MNSLVYLSVFFVLTMIFAYIIHRRTIDAIYTSTQTDDSIIGCGDGTIKKGRKCVINWFDGPGAQLSKSVLIKPGTYQILGEQFVSLEDIILGGGKMPRNVSLQVEGGDAAGFKAAFGGGERRAVFSVPMLNANPRAANARAANPRAADEARAANPR